MNSSDEQHVATLRDGGEFRLDEEAFTISRICDGKVESTVRHPGLPHGYAGGSIYLSPTERYILFAFYSGQSEEGFSVLRNGEDLELVFEAYYRSGEGASYGFSLEEDKLVQVLPLYCTEWYWPWLEGDTETDSAGNVFFPFGELNVLDLNTLGLTTHDVNVIPAADWKPKETDYDPFNHPRFVKADVVHVDWPWGTREHTLPIDGPIVFRPGDDG